MSEVFVGLGSNVEPESHIRSALDRLRDRFGPLTVSPVYRNPAVGFDGDDFLNLVVGFDTDRSVGDVALALAEIEAEHGRARDDAKFAPRTLDLDLLVYGDIVSGAGERPVLPREEILDRAFVLKPLADIYPEGLHPAAGASFRELWTRFPKDGIELEEVSL